MRNTITGLLICLCISVFGQRMEVPYTMHNGFGEIKERSFGGLDFRAFDPESVWGKMNIETTGAPEGYSVQRSETDIRQFVWQSYTQGKFSNETMLEFVEGWGIDTTSENLTREFIKCYVHVAIKKENDSTYLYIIDTNNDHDFSDEIIHTAALYDYKKVDSLYREHKHTFRYQYFTNNQVKWREAEILIIENDRKDFMPYLINFPHHAKGEIEHNGVKYPLYFQFAGGNRLQTEDEIEVMHPLDSSMVSKDQFIIIGRTGYKVLGANPSKEVLLLEKVALSAESSIAQKGFMVPEIAGVEFSTGDSIRLSDYRGKYVLLYIWATWCGPCYLTLPKLVALNDSISKDELQIFSAHLHSNSEVLPEVLQKNSIHWPQVLNTTCVSDLEDDFALRGVPYSFLINPEGRIIETGIHHKAKMVVAIREAIAEDSRE